MKQYLLLIVLTIIFLSCGEETGDNALTTSANSSDPTALVDTILYVDTTNVLDTVIVYDTIRNLMDSIVRIDSLQVIDTVEYIDIPKIKHTPRDTLIPIATSAYFDFPDRTESHIDCVIPMSELGNFNVAFNTGGERDYRIYNNDLSMTVQDPNWASEDGRKVIAANVVFLNPEHVFEWIVIDTIPLNQNFRVRGDDTLYFTNDSLFLSVVNDTSKSEKYVRALRRYENEHYLWGRVPHWPAGDELGHEQNFPMMNPLMYKPVSLRISHYYVNISEHSLVEGASMTTSETYHDGVEITEMSSFSQTISSSETKEVSVTAGSTWGSASASYSTTVDEAISNTSTHGSTITSTSENTLSLEISGAEAGTTIFVQWQKVEVFEFIDENGNKWDASEFGFDLKTTGADGIFGFKNYIPLSKKSVLTQDYFPTE